MTPSLEFRGQPFEEDPAMGAVLDRLLADPAIGELTMVVAWAKYRGLRRLRDALLAFRERGTSRIIVGIDQGGATAPGLRAARAWFSEAYVYHEAVPTTFHPKLFLAEGDTTAVLVVGSNNATPGGLWFNHEAALEARFSKPAENDHSALEGARQYIQRLLGDDEVCLPLTEDRIEELVRSKKFRVSAHERRQPAAHQRPPAPGTEIEDIDSDAITESEQEEPSIFGTSKHPKPAVPRLPPGVADELAEFEEPEAEEASESQGPTDETAATGAAEPGGNGATETTAGNGAGAPAVVSPPPAPAGAAAAAAAAGPTVVLWWDKQLPAGDAQQQPNPSTNPTGNLRLTQAKHPIDWRTWFRNIFFGGAAWVPDTDRNGNAIERTTLPMDVTIFGTALGTMHFDITHAKHRESGQSNHTTVLHWGPLMPTLRSTDYTDDTVTLSRMSDGTYRLEIS